MDSKTRNKFVYFLENAMYINVTNLCTNDCAFCIRDLNSSVGGVNLWLGDEKVNSNEIIAEIAKNITENCSEIVFCGYGEPLIRLETVKEVAKFVKQNYPEIPTRINTNGHADLIYKRNVVPELAGLIDKISVSLNAHTPELYQEICNSNFDKNEVFEAVKSFIAECVKHEIDTTATIVTGFEDYNIEIEQCRGIAESLGAKFRIREWLPDGY